jgi:hypothetical protein
LSASISTNGFSNLMGSPGRWNYRAIDNLTPASASVGTSISVCIELIPYD